MRERVPRLEDGSTYEVVIRNVSRLLRVGFSLPETRTIVLAKAGLSTFPRKPAPSSPTIH